jgi:hypothetical protein
MQNANFNLCGIKTNIREGCFLVMPERMNLHNHILFVFGTIWIMIKKMIKVGIRIHRNYEFPCEK